MGSQVFVCLLGFRKKTAINKDTEADRCCHFSAARILIQEHKPGLSFECYPENPTSDRATLLFSFFFSIFFFWHLSLFRCGSFLPTSGGMNHRLPYSVEKAFVSCFNRQAWKFLPVYDACLPSLQQGFPSCSLFFSCLFCFRCMTANPLILP